MTIVQRIGMPLVDQSFNQRNHLWNGLCRARFMIRGQAVQGFAILPKACDCGFRQFANINAPLLRTRIDLIVDIRDVPNIGDGRIECAQ